MDESIFFKDVEMILAPSLDMLFGLCSPYTGKPAVVDVLKDLGHQGASDVPNHPDGIYADMYWIRVGDSTGDYECIALVSHLFDFNHIMQDKSKNYMPLCGLLYILL